MMVSADASDPIDVITHGALPTGYPVEYPGRGWRWLYGPQLGCGYHASDDQFEILWSKASFEGNWLIQPAQLGDIDTSHVASVDSGTGGGDGDGGTSATVYDSTDILHLGNADPGSAAELTVSKTGDDQLTVMMVSADASDPIDVITHGALPTGATPSNIRVEDGVGYMDLSWAAGTMPATTSLEILWSKASFEGNWLIQPAQLGDIDTSHVASVDPGTGDTGGGDAGGGDVVHPEAVTAPTEDAATVISVFSDAYTDVDVVDFGPVWGTWQAARVTATEDGTMLKVSNMNNLQGMQIVILIPMRVQLMLRLRPVCIWTSMLSKRVALSSGLDLSRG